MKASKKKCGGKNSYPTFDVAVHAALVSSRRRGVALRPYDCATCGGYHLTKKPRGPVIATTTGPFTPSDLARIIANRSETTT